MRPDQTLPFLDDAGPPNQCFGIDEVKKLIPKTVFLCDSCFHRAANPRSPKW